MFLRHSVVRPTITYLRDIRTVTVVKNRGVSSYSSLGWPAGWPHLYLEGGGARIRDDIMYD